MDDATATNANIEIFANGVDRALDVASNRDTILATDRLKALETAAERRSDMHITHSQEGGKLAPEDRQRWEERFQGQDRKLALAMGSLGEDIKSAMYLNPQEKEAAAQRIEKVQERSGVIAIHDRGPTAYLNTSKQEEQAARSNEVAAYLNRAKEVAEKPDKDPATQLKRIESVVKDDVNAQREVKDLEKSGAPKKQILNLQREFGEVNKKLGKQAEGIQKKARTKGDLGLAKQAKAVQNTMQRQQGRGR